MNEFDDRKAASNEGSSGQEASGSNDEQPLSPRNSVDQGTLLLHALYDQLGSWTDIGKLVGVHRLTVTRWRDDGMSEENIEQLKVAMRLLKKKREETNAIGYVLHGEGEEPMPIEPLKQQVKAAANVRKLGLVDAADQIDRMVIALVDELDDHYGHPTLVGGKLKAIKAAAQTGLGKLQGAIATYDLAAQEMCAAGEPVEEYRYVLSGWFLKISKALAERDSPQSDLYVVLGQAKLFVQRQLPANASRAARCQRYGVGLCVFALLPPGKSDFLRWVRQMMDDEDAYDSAAEAYDAVIEDVADNANGRFDLVVEGNWLSSLRRP